MRNTGALCRTRNGGSVVAGEAGRRQQQVIIEATAKYDRFKKSASLPAYYLNKTRLKKITEIYRTLSTDKLRLSSKSRHSPAPQPRPAPFTPLNLNSLDHAKPKHKLTLQRQENTASPAHPGNSAWGQLVSQLRNFGERFEELLAIRSQESFNAELERSLEELRAKGRKDGRQEVGSCLRAFGECLARRERLRVGEVRREFAGVAADLSNLQVELKKKTIRAMLDQKEIERQQTSNKELNVQLADLRKRLTKETKEVAVGTNSLERTAQNSSLIFANTEVLTVREEGVVGRCGCRCSEKLEAKTVKLGECLRRLQRYSQRQKELLAVLVVLRGEGVDVERIYDDVMHGRIDSNDSDQDNILQSVLQAKRQSRKQEKEAAAAASTGSEFEADASLISSADGLSIDYGDLSGEEWAFTVRREYKCKHELDPALKERLRLNFDLLYDQQLYSDDDYESEQEGPSNPPTI